MLSLTPEQDVSFHSLDWGGELCPFLSLKFGKKAEGELGKLGACVLTRNKQSCFKNHFVSQF